MLGLQRNQEERLLLGVCSGISRSLGASPALFRLAFVVAGLASGIGVLLYVIFALLMDPPGVRGAGMRVRVRSNALALRVEFSRAVVALERWRRQTEVETDPAEAARTWFGTGALMLGLVIMLWSFGLFWWLDFWRTLGLVALLAGIGVLLPRASAARPGLRVPALISGIALAAFVVTAGASVEMVRIATEPSVEDAEVAEADARIREISGERAAAEARVAELERRVAMLEALPGLVAVMRNRAPAGPQDATDPTDVAPSDSRIPSWPTAR